jgi:L-seryl-tRNA(Ser) seleniumtransferase
VAAGADLICFSGDKLLGGPQAGIIIGKKALVEQLKRHPLARALRVDKTTLAGIQANLLHYLKGEALREIPIWRMISLPLDEIEARAASLAAQLGQAGIAAKIIPGASTVGGGSLPGETVPTRLLALRADSPDTLAARLRAGRPPVVARIQDDLLVFDLRTVLPEQDETLRIAIVRAFAA